MSATEVTQSGVTLDDLRARAAAATRAIGESFRALPGRIKAVAVRSGLWGWRSIKRLLSGIRNVLSFGGRKTLVGLSYIGGGATRLIGGTAWTSLEAVSWVLNTLRFVGSATYFATVMWAVIMGLTVSWVGDKTSLYLVRYPQAFSGWLGKGRPGTLREYTETAVQRREFTEAGRNFYTAFLRRGLDNYADATVEAADTAAERERHAKTVLGQVMPPGREYLEQYDELDLPTIMLHHVENYETAVANDDSDQVYWAARVFVLNRVIGEPEMLPRMTDAESALFLQQTPEIWENNEELGERLGINVEHEAQQGVDDELAALRKKLQPAGPTKKAQPKRQS